LIIIYCVQGYPYKKAEILKEAHKDIPPLYRGNIWAALLEVDGDIDGNYVAVDKETPTHTDRQVIAFQFVMFTRIQNHFKREQSKICHHDMFTSPVM
jgi:hypothetical protein